MGPITPRMKVLHTIGQAVPAEDSIPYELFPRFAAAARGDLVHIATSAGGAVTLNKMTNSITSETLYIVWTLGQCSEPCPDSVFVSAESAIDYYLTAVSRFLP